MHSAWETGAMRWMQATCWRRAVATTVGACMLAAALGGCSNAWPREDSEPYDPLEPENQAFFELNEGLDKFIMAPVAKGYAAVTPGFFRTGVTNFFDNADYPGVALNNMLQGKFERGLDDLARFIINSTFGLAGLIDFA